MVIGKKSSEINITWLRNKNTLEYRYRQVFFFSVHVSYFSMCIYFKTLTLNIPLLVNNVFVDLNDDLKEFQNGGSRFSQR